MQRVLETPVPSLGREGALEEEMATHSSTLAWETPWTEEPGGLYSTGSQSWTPLSPTCSWERGLQSDPWPWLLSQEGNPETLRTSLTPRTSCIQTAALVSKDLVQTPAQPLPAEFPLTTGTLASLGLGVLTC